MANKFYDPGGRRADKVKDLFATVAPRYDLINDLQSFGLHRRWKRRLAHLARVKPGERALDLCCGTGDVAFALARLGAEVTGVDFSEPMLAIAAKRRLESAREVRDRVEFLQGDAQRIGFASGSFDVVTVAYGLRNLSDWRLGLREMHRVVRPGGRLLALDFGKPDNRLWRRIYFGYLGIGIPVFGRLFCGDPETHGYILESLRAYPAQVGVAEEMRGLGCANVRILNLLGGAMSVNYGEKP